MRPEDVVDPLHLGLVEDTGGDDLRRVDGAGGDARLDGVRLTLVDRPVGDEPVERAPRLHQETRRHAGVGSARLGPCRRLGGPLLHRTLRRLGASAAGGGDAGASGEQRDGQQAGDGDGAPPPRKCVESTRRPPWSVVRHAGPPVAITFAHPPEAALKDTASSADLQLATGIIGS